MGFPNASAFRSEHLGGEGLTSGRSQDSPWLPTCLWPSCGRLCLTLPELRLSPGGEGVLWAGRGGHLASNCFQGLFQGSSFLRTPVVSDPGVSPPGTWVLSRDDGASCGLLSLLFRVTSFGLLLSSAELLLSSCSIPPILFPGVLRLLPLIPSFSETEVRLEATLRLVFIQKPRHELCLSLLDAVHNWFISSEFEFSF